MSEDFLHMPDEELVSRMRADIMRMHVDPDARSVDIELDTHAGICVAELLQLALSHPDNSHTPSQIANKVRERLLEQIIGEPPDVTLHMQALEAFIVLAHLQLAMRHPHASQSPLMQTGFRVAEQIQQQMRLAEMPALAEVVRRGWIGNEPVNDRLRQ